MMDLASCSAVYVDERIRRSQWVDSVCSDFRHVCNDEEVQILVDVFSRTFKRLYICNSSERFLEVVSQLNAENDSGDRHGDGISNGSNCGFPGDVIREQSTSIPRLLPVFGFIDIPSEPYQVSRTWAALSSQVAEHSSISPMTSYIHPKTDKLMVNGDHNLQPPSSPKNEPEQPYGLRLVNLLSTELQTQDEPKNHLVIPVAVLRPRKFEEEQRRNPSIKVDDTATKYPISTDTTVSSDSSTGITGISSVEASQDKPSSVEERYAHQCLDAGAVEVLIGTPSADSLRPLRTCAYRAHRIAARQRSRFTNVRHKPRKHSWMGVDAEDSQVPYSYLRESMVSKLMTRICNPEKAIDEVIEPSTLSFKQKASVRAEVGKWTFDAHGFSDDEMLYAACIMFEHALQMPELAEWRLSSQEIYHFVYASRMAYNSFVLYHNFRHAVDVLQSTFYFLLKNNLLPTYRHYDTPFTLSSQQSSQRRPPPGNPLSVLLDPFSSLVLLVAALGHDVGHPGVNNNFLVKLKSPLAQLYNDASVLESFHCAAYSQILRRYWPTVFHDVCVRKLMISSILATDMSLHNNYMEQMAGLTEKCEKENGIAGFTDKEIESMRTLICALMIKAADISNVARCWPVATSWTDILQREFHNQGEMERVVGMDESTLFGGPPDLENIIALAKSQIGFMEFLAGPLFEGLAHLEKLWVRKRTRSTSGDGPFTEAAREIRNNRAMWKDVVCRETGGTEKKDDRRGHEREDDEDDDDSDDATHEDDVGKQLLEKGETEPNGNGLEEQADDANGNPRGHAEMHSRNDQRGFSQSWAYDVFLFCAI